MKKKMEYKGNGLQDCFIITNCRLSLILVNMVYQVIVHELLQK